VKIGHAPIDAEAYQEKLADTLQAHQTWRGECLNLTASENMTSPAVRGALLNDLVHRYADLTSDDLSVRRYRGTRWVAEIETAVTDCARLVFRAAQIDLRPLSGHVAGTAVIMGLCHPGDTVLELGRAAGGHRLAAKLALIPLVSLNVLPLPFNDNQYNVDPGAAADLIAECQPRLVILGSSNFLFPHPVREVADAVHDVPGAVLAYDASHVMGFLAANRFQDPLREGADIVFGSTHKTLPGPQGGIILSNDPALMASVRGTLYPGLVANHHPFRIPALGLALAEMARWGAQYADTTVANARALAKALGAVGVRTVASAYGSTLSHTLLIEVIGFGTAESMTKRLEECNVITTHVALPDAFGGEGIRIGTQEVTRMGAEPALMPALAQVIADALRGARTEAVKTRAIRLASSLGPIRFTWPPS
jgi:glycine hydroxymethyltransferase